MSLNLHGIVRQAIQVANPDLTATLTRSAGYTVTASGQQVPAYSNPVNVRIQAQPPSGRDLWRANYLNLQGTLRTVFLYSDPQAIVRVTAQGGDLLQFPMFAGDPPSTWLVTEVLEAWSVERGGWSKVIVTLQTDAP